MTNSKQIYFNRGQRELLAIGANSETIIASRRFGKSDGVIAPRMLRNAQHMPRSAGAVYAATFQQALSRTIPAAVHAVDVHLRREVTERTIDHPRGVRNETITELLQSSQIRKLQTTLH